MATTPEEKAPEKKPEPADHVSVTRHRAKIAGREIAYTVTCGTLVLREQAEKEGKSEGEKARAKVFFIAYTLDDAPDKAKRPVTFSFNGGDGSCSLWPDPAVHGPKRVVLDQPGIDSSP